MRPNKNIRNKVDSTSRDPSDYADFPPLLVRVSDGHTIHICQMPLEAVLFLIRNRLCTVVGDVAVAPTMVLEGEEVEAMFDAITPTHRSIAA